MILTLIGAGVLTLGTVRVARAAPLAQEGEDATLRVINESEATICAVYISPITSDEWGDDWLSEEETIPSDESRAFGVTTAGDYDVGLADC
jgi:hypothetical protein